jgi:uncharacterized iron-regulated membrane protein
VTVRGVLVVLHRYLGLATAGFLVVAGLTGSVIAFQAELDAWLNPDFYAVPEHPPEARPLGPAALAAEVERGAGGRLVWYVAFPAEPERPALAVAMRDPGAEAAAAPAPAAAAPNWFLLDPVEGGILGARRWGACCFAPENLIPFLYNFHHTLALPEPWGVWLMGAAAVFWLFDCFVGFALTLPRGRPFLGRWARAWQPPGAPRRAPYRFVVDLHRAGALWCWLLLLCVAVTSVAMNLEDEVFEPAVEVFSPLQESVFEAHPELARETPGRPAFDFDEMVEMARAEAARRAWQRPPGEVFFSPFFDIFGVGFPAERGSLGALEARWLYFDSRTGEFLQAWIPGQGSGGDVFSHLMFPLHSGKIGGLAGRTVVCLLGLALAVFAVTGVIIWDRKRRARRVSRARAQARAGAAAA